MNIFGKYVSVAVIWGAIVSLGTLVLGVVTNIANNWHTTNPEGLILLIAGGSMTILTGALHIWDTMPSNVTAHDAAKAGATRPASATTVVNNNAGIAPADPAVA